MARKAKGTKTLLLEVVTPTLRALTKIAASLAVEVDEAAEWLLARGLGTTRRRRTA